MKNSLKKLISLLTVFVMVVALVPKVAAISFPDVSSADQEAVQVLAAFGILKGYDDGTFGGDKVITRAEMMTVATRLRGLDDTGIKQTDTVFPDVTAAYWYSGYINTAYNLGIVVGYPDGTFGPDKTVTYAEAVTIIARALGYAPQADEQAWPNGYTYVGAQTGFTKGVTASNDDGATRSVVAKMLYQALGVNLMVRNYYSSGEKQYGVDPTKTVLSEYLAVAKVKGTIEGYDYNTGKAQVLISDNFGSSIYSIKAVPTPAVAGATTYNDVFYPGSTDAISYVGRDVVAYISVPNATALDKTPTLKVILPDPTVKTLSITSEDLVSSPDLTSYFTDKYNGTAVTIPGGSALTYSPTHNVSYDKITLTATSTTYNQVFVTGYTADVIKAIDTVNKQIVLRNDTISYATGSDLVLTDANGAVLDPSTLTAGSVITYTDYATDYASSNNATITIPAGMKVIRGAVTQAVTGTVSDISANGVCVIGGNKYDLLGGSVTGVSVGATGTFDVSADNIIFSFESSVAKNGNYAVVTKFVPGAGSIPNTIDYYDASGNYNVDVPIASNVLYDGSQDLTGVTDAFSDVNNPLPLPFTVQTNNGKITSVADVSAPTSVIKYYWDSNKVSTGAKVTSNTVVLRARLGAYTPVDLLSMKDDQDFSVPDSNSPTGFKTVGAVYDVNSKNEVGLLVIGDGYKIQSSSYNLAYIASKTETTLNGVKVSYFNYRECGATGNQGAAADYFYNNASDPGVGDVVALVKNSNGIITDLYEIGTDGSLDTSSAKYYTTTISSSMSFADSPSILVVNSNKTTFVSPTPSSAQVMANYGGATAYEKLDGSGRITQLVVVQ